MLFEQEKYTHARTQTCIALHPIRRHSGARMMAILWRRRLYISPRSCLFVQSIDRTNRVECVRGTPSLFGMCVGVSLSLFFTRTVRMFVCLCIRFDECSVNLNNAPSGLGFYLWNVECTTIYTPFRRPKH